MLGRLEELVERELAQRVRNRALEWEFRQVRIQLLGQTCRILRPWIRAWGWAWAWA
jgi:hypothetical protein